VDSLVVKRDKLLIKIKINIKIIIIVIKISKEIKV
jgi:hypothetical protein